MVLVEDETLVRETLQFGLEDAGFVVTALSTPGAALKLFAADGCEVDALVTNIDLHASIDGFELARRAVAKIPRLKVIYVSGSAEGRFATERVADGRFLPKPFLSNALECVLSDALGVAP